MPTRILFVALRIFLLNFIVVCFFTLMLTHLAKGKKWCKNRFLVSFITSVVVALLISIPTIYLHCKGHYELAAIIFSVFMIPIAAAPTIVVTIMDKKGDTLDNNKEVK